MKYWINVLSRDHVLAGLTEGFTQASQDKAANLHLLRKGDLVFFYSPGTLFRAGEILQAFTAVARVTDDAPYQVELSARVRPWRVKATSLACTEAPIEPLIPQLSFIEDKVNWGTSLPRGLFQVGEGDARRIAEAMNADIGR